MVVVLGPPSDHHACFEQGAEQFAVEQFVAHGAVEAFYVAVLLQSALGDECRAHLLFETGSRTQSIPMLTEPRNRGLADALIVCCDGP
jgi:hypothetical protein